MNQKIKEEAEAFDCRIESRIENGFIPDLRNLKPNSFFYKSFWRDPYYTKLYLGEICNHFIKQLSQHLSSGSRVLDVGCGAGYFALEIARQGYSVVGIDISSSCIDVAQETLLNIDIKPNFGSLEYHNCAVTDLSKFEKFDAVICSGVLHHLESLPECLDLIQLSLNNNGVLIWHEPQHKYWTENDASIVALIRLLLANLNMWHDEKVKEVTTAKELLNMSDEIHQEYLYERDPNEMKGQSPNDLISDRDTIVGEIGKRFEILDVQQSFSFIYRLMGGMRGDQEVLNRLAYILQLFDKTMSSKGIINSNYFYGKARKI
jgi:2-polyprenyl-3-methyl-5-hydroxy-6-metoxy-1,4-benzoquinol methylase